MEDIGGTDLKTCTGCHEAKPKSEYARQHNGRDGLRAWCADCHRAYRRRHYEAHAEELKAKRHAYYWARPEHARAVGRLNALSSRLRRAHGITLDDYEAQKVAQDGCCAICHRIPKRWALDHNHATGRIRGLLCTDCNSGIGLLGDDPACLSEAISYIEKDGVWET